MKSIVEKYGQQLEALNKEVLLPIVKDIMVVEYPSEFEKFKQKFSPNKTIVTGESISTEQAISIVYEHNIQHIIQSDRNDFFYQLLASALIMKAPTKFIKNPLPFFLKSNFKNPLNELLQREKKLLFESTEDKKKILLEVEKFLSEDSKTSIFTENVLLIVNELILNAIFNAPVDKDNKPILLNVERSKAVKYPKDKFGTLHVAHDEEQLFIACEDPYGSMDFNQLLNRLYQIFVNGDSTPRMGFRSAGLGIKLIIDNSSSVYFVVEKGKKTFVCCSFPLGMGFKKVMRLPKTLHFKEF